MHYKVRVHILQWYDHTKAGTAELFKTLTLIHLIYIFMKWLPTD